MLAPEQLISRLVHSVELPSFDTRQSTRFVTSQRGRYLRSEAAVTVAMPAPTGLFDIDVFLGIEVKKPRTLLIIRIVPVAFLLSTATITYAYGDCKFFVINF